MKIIKHLSILILILLPNIPCVSQFYYLESEQRIQNQILDLNYDNILPVETNLPNGIRFWLQGYQAFVCQLTSSVKRSTDSTLKVIQKMEQQIRALDSKSPYYNYCIADLNLMQSYLYLRENNPFYSARTFWKARNHYLLNIEKYPDFLPNQKHQLIDIAVIEWLNDMFVYSTKKNNNPSNELLLTNFWQDLLEKASKEETLLREVKILGYLIDASFKGNYNLVDVKKKDAINIFASEGPLESFCSQWVLKKHEHYTQQLQILYQADSLGYIHRFNILNLYLGIAYLNQTNPKAEKYLMKFIESQHKEQYLSYTYLKLSWLYLLKKQPAEFKKCLHKIQDLTTSTTDEDQQAKYEIIHANDWNQGLIKSRLLFDGGNYSQAIIELLHMKTELPQFTEGQKLEYAYRLARSYDKLGDYEKAIRFYQMVAGSDLQSTFYYPSYAAYFLAQIYIKLQKPHEAKAYFNTCLKKDSPIYKSEIHRKAKDGLLKLN